MLFIIKKYYKVTTKMCNQLAMIRNKIKKHDKVYIKRRQILYYFQRCDKKSNVYITYSLQYNQFLS